MDDPEALPISDSWDAGEMGCGELVLHLRGKMLRLQPAQILRLVARDPGARADLPAWCELTRHHLRAAHHPIYSIERRKDP